MAAPDEAKGPEGPSFEMREAVTVEKGGRRRRGSQTEPPGDTFRIRGAETVRQGEDGAQAGTPAPLAAGPTAIFEVREASTQTQDPPHWAALRRSTGEMSAPLEVPEIELPAEETKPGEMASASGRDARPTEKEE